VKPRVSKDEDSAGASATAAGIDAATFDRLFPFHLAIDRRLRITRAGPVLRRVVPSLTIGAPLPEHFTVRRPAILLDFEALRRETETIFLLAAHAPADLVLKGQIVPMSGSKTGAEEELGFLGTPWITSLDALPRLGLTVSDFALHDAIADFLVLVQAQRAALDDAQRLARQLSEARDTALQASRVKSEFLANMSHELRTPLNAIIGFSEMLAGATLGPLPDVYQNYADYIRTSGVMLLDLINDLLDLSRIEAGQYELEESEIAIAPALEECLQLVRGDAERKRIALRIDPGPSDLVLRADLRAFKQIFLNLLSNAVKFTDDGGHVSVRATVGPDGTVFTVADSGIGVAPEKIPHLFEPFRQGHAGLSRKYGGTGLGLSICRSLVDLHGGRIGMDSQLGVGTTITVRLPPGRTMRGG
jgi:signal transduction histidine kinase